MNYSYLGIREGDQVRITEFEIYGGEDHNYNGREGIVLEVDTIDDLQPYKVTFNDGHEDITRWVYRVDRTAPPEADAATHRVAVIDESTVNEFIKSHGLNDSAARNLFHLLGFAGVMIAEEK